MDFTVKRFWEGIGNDELYGNLCKDCGTMMLPPRPICMNCGSTNLEPKTYKGEGVIATKTKIYVSLPRFSDRCPHGVAVVKLDEGVSISGLLLEDVEIGEKVEAVYLVHGEGKVLAFKPL